MTNFSIAGASAQAYTQTRPHPDPAPERPPEPHDTNTRSAIRLATLRNPSRSTEPIWVRPGARQAPPPAVPSDGRRTIRTRVLAQPTPAGLTPRRPPREKHR